jgi:DNA (cytosine-5)-methyltransferase 1
MIYPPPAANNVDTPQINHLSVCAGYGGIDLGLGRVLAGCRTVAYVEIEAFAVANLVAKMEKGELDQAPVWTDIKTFNAEPFRGLVDILSGGYPCQPFSAAGKRRGEEDPRHLWPFFRRAIRVIRPARVFLENVEGHITLGLSTVVSDMEEDGYRCSWGIFSATEVGAPHQRKRVFIMADSNMSCPTRFKQQRRKSCNQQKTKRIVPPGSDVANGKCAGLERHSGDEQDQAGQEGAGSGGSVGPSGLPQRFPAGPGPQFDWEEPRTVGNATGKRQAEQQLGRATDGCTSRLDTTAYRVDRLRLLGNGVVPATAAKAWTVLSDSL